MTITPEICSHCRQRPVRAKGLCGRCYEYKRVFGRDRVIKKDPARWCKNCGRLQIRRMTRCATCDTYWKRNHMERPRYLWDIEATCRNCKFPFSALPPRKNGRKRQCKGRCQPCDSYWRKYKQERPRRLWGDGPHGFCLCGYPAVALVEDMPVCTRHKE